MEYCLLSHACEYLQGQPGGGCDACDALPTFWALNAAEVKGLVRGATGQTRYLPYM